MAVKSKAQQSGSRKAAAPPKTEEQGAAPAEAQERDSPLLDLSDQSVKRLLKTAKARGYVTLDELNSVLPSEEVSPDQIEDTMAMLSDMGINVVETEEGEEAFARICELQGQLERLIGAETSASMAEDDPRP